METEGETAIMRGRSGGGGGGGLAVVMFPTSSVVVVGARRFCDCRFIHCL